MELLVSYGWAILILTIVVGVLFMLGLFNPGRFSPDVCSLPSGFACNSYKITNGGVLQLDLSQSTGSDITVTKFACSAQASPSPTSITNQTIRSGRHKNLTGLPNCAKKDGTYPSSGEYYSGKLIIEYNESATSITHQITGNIAYHVE